MQGESASVQHDVCATLQVSGGLLHASAVALLIKVCRCWSRRWRRRLAFPTPRQVGMQLLHFSACRGQLLRVHWP